MSSHLLPTCDDRLPKDLRTKLVELALLWAKHPGRPRIDDDIAQHWNNLIEQWSIDPELPLLIRKSEKGIARGEVVLHQTERKLMLTDNSPASWSYMMAFSKVKPSLEDIRGYLERDEIPVAMVKDREMVARSSYKCTRSAIVNPNVMGWKVCHRQKVALQGRGPINQRRISDLQYHFRLFLAPSNMFLVPLKLGGLGELPQFCEAMQDEQPGRDGSLSEAANTKAVGG